MRKCKEKILVVDDSKLNLKMLTKILEDKYIIFTSATGEGAVELALKESPDLVLLDVILPDIDGFEVIKKFKNTDELRNIPIIFITGLSFKEDELRGLKLGAIDYIKKPFVEEIVRARVDNQILLCRQRKLVEEIAHYDALTQIPNRRNFENRLKCECSYAIENQTFFSIGYFDIDYFKQFNDNYGHAKGDEALRQAASCASRIVEKYEGYIARIGGEEFCFMFPDSEDVNPLYVSDEIRKAIYDSEIEHKYSKIDDKLTVSVGGVTSKLEKGCDIAKILKHADDNMYKAKAKNRNCVVWDVI